MSDAASQRTTYLSPAIDAANRGLGWAFLATAWSICRKMRSFHVPNVERRLPKPTYRQLRLDEILANAARR